MQSISSGMNSSTSVVLFEHPRGTLSTRETIEFTIWDRDRDRLSHITNLKAQTYLTTSYGSGNTAISP